MLRERAHDLVDLAATQQVDWTSVSEVGIDSLQPFAGPRFSEDPLGLGENELESVHACGMCRVGSAAVHPPRNRAALHSQHRRELRLSSEIACQGFGLHFRGKRHATNIVAS